MAEVVSIPSPSENLNPPVEAPPADTHARRRVRIQEPEPDSSEKPCDDAGASKPKRTKSRGGCKTCKVKRIKCDERKPTCQTCQDRNVECEGYVVDWKWLSGLESTRKTKRKTTGQLGLSHAAAHHQRRRSGDGSGRSRRSSPQSASEAPTGNDGSAVTGAPESIPFDAALFPDMPGLSATAGECFPSIDGQGTSISDDMLRWQLLGEDLALDFANSLDIPTTDFELTMRPHNLDQQSLDSEPSMPPNSLENQPAVFGPDLPHYTDENLMDALQMAQGSHDNVLTTDVLDDNGFSRVDGRLQDIHELSDTDEEISPSRRRAKLARLTSLSDHHQRIPPRPLFALENVEMLSLRFHNETCGIMSMKNGPTENPWRTLIWPLAQASPPLLDALAAMTCFQAAYTSPIMVSQGAMHLDRSVKAVNQWCMGKIRMDWDESIATTLALAWTESWDKHTSSGVSHIKAARALFDRASTRHREKAYQGAQLARLKFLYKSWTYMDVLARLIAPVEDEYLGFENNHPIWSDPAEDSIRIDPLMGCASTLFSIIGRVANLVRRIWRLPKNNPDIISRGQELMEALENWRPPKQQVIEDPEDNSCTVLHSLQTAEAYRWATMLHLHQSVPEIPSKSSKELAYKALDFLEKVPLESRTVIVQMYPLLAAGCEIRKQQQRDWIRQRWKAMAHRMHLGIIDKCLEIQEEVWRRRDEHKASSKGSGNRRSASDIDALLNLPGLRIPPGIDLDGATIGKNSPEVMMNGPSGRRDGAHEPMDNRYTTRGSLHWLGVMRDWDWQVLIG